MFNVAGSPTQKLHLLTFPEELQVHILSHLEIEDIVACIQACIDAFADDDIADASLRWQTCRALKSVIVDAPALQYKMALKRHAMIEGPSAASKNVALRLKEVEDYQAALDSSEVVLKSPPQDKGQVCWGTGGVKPFIASDDDGSPEVVTLVRQDSPVAGHTAKEWVVDVSNAQIDSPSTGSCAVDVMQDLLVITTLELGE